jgi:hypothetical protein
MPGQMPYQWAIAEERRRNALAGTQREGAGGLKGQPAEGAGGTNRSDTTASLPRDQAPSVTQGQDDYMPTPGPVSAAAVREAGLVRSGQRPGAAPAAAPRGAVPDAKTAIDILERGPGGGLVAPPQEGLISRGFAPPRSDMPYADEPVDLQALTQGQLVQDALAREVLDKRYTPAVGEAAAQQAEPAQKGFIEPPEPEETIYETTDKRGRKVYKNRPRERPLPIEAAKRASAFDDLQQIVAPYEEKLAELDRQIAQIQQLGAVAITDHQQSGGQPQRGVSPQKVQAQLEALKAERRRIEQAMLLRASAAFGQSFRGVAEERAPDLQEQMLREQGWKAAQEAEEAKKEKRGEGGGAGTVG